MEQLAQACRFVWNAVLAENEEDMLLHEMYGAEKPSTSFFSLGKRVKHLRVDHDWLSEHSFAVTRYALKRQADAWRAFFKGQGSRPRFKRYDQADSFTIPDYVRIRSGRLHVPKLGKVALSGSNPYPDGEPKLVVCWRDAAGAWWATVSYEVADETPIDNGLAVGVDLNHAARAVSVSTGDVLPFPAANRIEARRRRYQRVVARRKKGSSRRGLAKRRAAKAQRKLARVRKDWQHQVSRVLANTAGMVCFEDLKVQSMSRKGRGKRGLNRENLRVGWRGLRAKLEYKSAAPVAVRPSGTSVTCSSCGARGERRKTVFRCGCGHRDHADLNAARNILASGAGASGRGEALALATSMIRQYMPLRLAAAAVKPAV